MEEDAMMHAVYDDIYLFMIEQPVIGYARFGRVYKRDTAGSRRTALSEITSSARPAAWHDVTSKHAADDLDMRFAPDTKALIFVMTPGRFGTTWTAFGDKKVVDLAVKRKGSKPIVDRTDRHPMGTTSNLICSFEIDIPSVAPDINEGGPSHMITRLPIMFDFEDQPDGISPVFKKPHGVPVIELDPLGHGGIHPRGGSSLIVIE